MGRLVLSRPLLLPYEGLVASRARMLTQASSSSNQQTMARSAHIATEDLSSIRVVFSGFYNCGANGGNPIPDTGVGADTTITASVEYPSGTFTQLKFGGSATGTITDGSVLFSDQVSVSIPSGETFWIRNWRSNPITGAVMFNPWQNSTLGELINVGATVADQTMGGTISNAIGWSSPPLAILGTTINPSVIIIGDSIAAGYADSEDSSASVTGYNGKVGVIARSLGNIPFLNLAVSGENAYTWMSDASARKLLIQKGSHLISELGLSDIINHGQTVSNTITALQLIYALAHSSQKVFQTTWTPHSSSTDNWATLVNQTAEDNAARTSFNTSARAVLSGTIGTIDVASVLESSLNSGLWVVPSYVYDGVHPNPAGYELVATSGIVPTPTWP